MNLIRNHVAKNLSVALKSRSHRKLDFDKLGKKIESRIFLSFNGQVKEKYKNKFRTIMFNIKDKKNNLFRRIIHGTISPTALVRMTTAQMANKELKKWRTLESEKNIEKIQSNQLEMLKIGTKFVYKTHKGENVNKIAQPDV